MTRDSYRHIRSAVFEKRPLSTAVLDGELAVNYHTDSVGVYLRDTLGKIRKVGPAHIGTLPPTPINYTDLSDGELWIDISGSTPAVRYYDESTDTWPSIGIFDSALDANHIIAGDPSGSAKPYLLDPGSFFVDNTVGSLEVRLADNINIPGTLDVTGIATFDTKISIGAAEPAAQQEVGWNTDKGTLDIGLLNGVISPYGQDIITLCRNNTASTIAKGAAVMFTGTIGNSGILTIAPMVSNGTYPGYVFFGVTAQSIAAGADGYIRSFGEIKGVNTDIDEGGVGGQWVEGDILWCNPATPGGFTKFEPLAPNLKLPVAAVVSVGNNGILFVRWDAGRRLQDLHDVDANGATTDGNLLQYSAINSRWEHRTDVTLPGRVVINGSDITESARDVEESRLIRKNATVSIGVAGTVPFGVGPVIPPGVSLVGIGPDSYNVIDIYSGSVC